MSTSLAIEDLGGRVMSARVSSPIFVGRRHELDRVGLAMAGAREGHASVVLLAGEAGVGKTRFVREIEKGAAASGVRVLEGGCVQVGTEGIPFGPVIEALRDLANDVPRPDLELLLGAGRPELVRLMPQLLRPGDDATARSPADSSAQGRLFEHLLLFLGRLAGQAPLLLVLEDIHWADQSTLQLLGFLARNLRSQAVVLIATYRSDELHRRHPLMPFLAEQERVGRAERLELNRFDRGELTAQLDAILGGTTESDLVERIWARSAGNAFFAEELLAAGTQGRLPETLREVLLGRVATLPERTQVVVRIASAGGTRISPRVLGSVAAADEDVVEASIRDALVAHLLVPAGGAGDEDGFAFRHALVQEAVYAELLPGERARLHAAYAHAFEDQGASAAEIAHQWQAAHDLPRAFDAWIRAGIAAEAMFASAEAAADFDRALELWDRVPDAAARAPLDRIDLLRRAALAAEGPAPARSVEYIRAAIALVDPVTDPVRAGLLYERLGHTTSFVYDPGVSFAAHQEAVRLVPADPPSAARAQVLAGLGTQLFLVDRYAESVTACEGALAVARQAGVPLVWAMPPLGAALVELGEVEQGLATLRRARELASELGSVWEVARAMGWLSAMLVRMGRDEEAVAAAAEGVDYAVNHGLGARWGTSDIAYAADALIALGRWDEVRRVLERGRGFEMAGTEAVLNPTLVLFDALRGDLGAARRRAREINLAGAYFPFDLVRGVAEAALWAGEPVAARKAVRQALQTPRPEAMLPVRSFGWAMAVGLRAEAYLAASARARRADSDLEEARALGADLLGRMRALAVEVTQRRTYFAPMARAWLALCEAEYGRLEGQPDANRWALAAAAFAGQPYFRSYALMREGEAALGGRPDPGRAAAVLAEALEIAVRLGAEPLRRAVEALAAVTKPRPARAATLASGASGPRSLFNLSSREREVLKLLAAGQSDGEIGRALFISKKTASVHVANIKGKLGAGSRVEIVVKAINLGLVEAGPAQTA